MSKTALVVIDAQNDYFPGGRFALHRMDEAAANVAKLIARFRANKAFIAHIRHEFPDVGAPFFEAGTHGAQIHESVAAQGGEPVVLKHQINSFRDTELKALLDARGIGHVVICGAMSHMCIDAGTRAASDFGYAVTVVHDACATKALEFNGITVPPELVHAAFMSALGFAYAKVVSTQDFLSQGD